MSASLQMVTAFEAWKVAELAAYYASPCPDEVMNALCSISSVAFDRLQETPVTSADDMLLKMFPLMLREFEPMRGQAPLRPVQSTSYNYDRAFVDRLCDELAKLSPALADAIAQPPKAA